MKPPFPIGIYIWELPVFIDGMSLKWSGKFNGLAEEAKEVCMHRRAVTVFATLLLLPILGSTQVSVTALVADITFPFGAGGNLFQAGTYEFRASAQTDVVTVTNMKTRQTFDIPVLTRLSARTPEESSLVFDKMKDQTYLSELYFPGADGFHVAGAPGPHTHLVVKSKKS